MILDNSSHGKVGEELKKKFEKGSKLSVISSFFSLFAFDEMKKELDRIEAIRFLIPQQSLLVGHDSVMFNGLSGSAADRNLRNKLNISKIAKECSEWVKGKTEFRLSKSSVPSSMFHLSWPNSGQLAIHGSSGFSTEGLGFAPSEALYMNNCTTDESETSSLLEWFDSIWNNEQTSRNIKNTLLQQLEDIFKDKSPQLIYFHILYNIFRDFLGELEEENIIKTRTGIKESIVWNKLYKFQRDGVLGAIDKIERYNGCIIADSVGLGKTFEALAIIKYYELRNDRVLVLCPKKLRENWTLYTVNDKRNLLADDRFNYDVLNHTDLTRTTGKSGEINLQTINWGNYDLIVIDESHNFRNNPPRKDGLTRYKRLMQDIIKSGVRTKVLMLSATPVNNRMNDLKNQASFITEGVDDALHAHGIVSLEQTLKQAQARFNIWLKQEESQRTTESLLDTLNFDYFKLLDLLTIARSRKHIVKYYDIEEIGQFPERLKPRNIKADIDSEAKFPPLSEINRIIRQLNLSAYSPLKYILPHKREEYSRKYDKQVSGGSVFKQVDREQSLIHLMRVNLFKRMESSINSFSLTLEKLLYQVSTILEKIEAYDEMEVEELNIEDIEVENDEFQPFAIGSKVKVLIQDVDRIKWKQELEEDRGLLEKVLEEAREIGAERDQKLASIMQVIKEKVQNPINEGNKKVIIFTAFADTANYLYEHIAKWAQVDLGLHSALVTGTGNNKTTMPGINKDMASIITSFSPLSKERSKIDDTLAEEIDIMIATDCISEGQNLQDCDYLINYDIHWNPVRIIQRFGRIDRLGSINNAIQLVNFWPNIELDEYINLEARVSGRMVLLDISATGEENIIEFSDAGKMNDLEYRRKQLERLQNEVVDIEDLGSGISITDLTLNDFRMDLSEYLKGEQDLDHTPFGSFAVVDRSDFSDLALEPGVIFCLKSENEKVKTGAGYVMYPYFLVYVTSNGDVHLNFSQPKKTLDILKRLSQQQKPDADTVSLFDTRTNGLADMELYQSMLANAVSAITGKAEEYGVESLFQRGGTAMSRDTFRGIDDFEVVGYLIILDRKEDP